MHMIYFSRVPVSMLAHLLFALVLSYFQLYLSKATTDTIFQGQSINVSETIVSTGNEFELGFFRPGNSTSYYLGIWFKKVSEQTVVWVANRDSPLSSSPVLTVGKDGNLAILDGRISTYAVSNVSMVGVTSAALLDSGNFVLRDVNSGAILWQGFDYPSHTLLPGMKIGFDQRSGKTWSLASWKSSEDPRAGAFSLQLDPEGRRGQLLIMQGAKRYWASGTWNGHSFILALDETLDSINHFSYVSNQNETYFLYSSSSAVSVTSRIVLDISGQIKLMMWSEEAKHWNLNWSQPRQPCEVYAYCGAFGSCDKNAVRFCDCMPGFAPLSTKNWELGDTSGGCARGAPLGCQRGTTNASSERDGFVLISQVVLPLNSLYLEVGSAVDCELACLNNCSCSGYAHDYSNGCLIWVGDLFNLQRVSVNADPAGKEFHLKLAALEGDSKGFGSKRWIWKIINPIIFLTTLALIFFIFFIMWRRKFHRRGGQAGEDLLLFDYDTSSLWSTGNELGESSGLGSGGRKDVKLPLFSFASVSAATDNFSAVGKLGEGGFGPVYKGLLQKGQEVAVKRLSKGSCQGWEELKNEAVLIAKLQHKNLVRLLGCCIEQDEKMLIYEYLPNKSLDFFLFDRSKRGMLDWSTRKRIIEGIAQGLLYLHEYSRFRIIHRDLKASNILLDKDMNPKISDFGMARIFGANESQATNRIVGTYGYMSPEYAMDGLFSIKSDVFSFGVLLLEILSGKKNTGLYYSRSLNLLIYARDLWEMGKEVELIDPILIGDRTSTHEQLRYIKVALLCVQESTADRPTMSDVVSMLSNGTQVLPSPILPSSSIVRNACVTVSATHG
ncbi:receptor-like serine/threonine-protein kinase SD1-8 [Malania oleifera]|uniref:receptor-like serine/threonine-protein kinase SD1-8 n=1 Tax=Malania oleifera TaxID=397392 RepID=UPI0025ADB8EE|nr:receptor-like serine/threonine-protein kinase SD1-8 [Malania oleifera]